MGGKKGLGSVNHGKPVRVRAQKKVDSKMAVAALTWGKLNVPEER